MKRSFNLMLLALFWLTAGCAAAPVQHEPIIPAKRPVSEYAKPGIPRTIDAYDPWEGMNRRIYNFNAIFDEYVFLPVVRAYEFVLPDIAQTGVSNFYKNLTEITNLTNSLLQFKIVKAVNTLGRIVINTTVGLGGLIDVAGTVDGIERENEDFGQTLGFYGLGPGPYLVLPILGPSSVRDTTGLVVDTVVYSLMMQELIVQLGMSDTQEQILNYSLSGLYAIDKRHTESFRYFMTGSPFEYDLIRKLFLLQREFLIDN
ncbi:MAG: VacJ family lipoprotein [Desulfobacterales bacterium]|jgi:phospholipid-binding lipoprotein MlaA|nr:VacJ family lipoprotein [Desulfobacterales bacterium]